MLGPGHRQATAAPILEDPRHLELFEYVNDFVAVLDLEGEFTWLSSNVEALTGYSRAELLGRHYSEIVAPEHLERVREQLELKIAGKAEGTVYEIEILTRAGRRVPLEISSRIVSDDGKPVAVVGIARDLAERKRTEGELHEATETLRALVDASPLAIIQLDLEGRVLLWNAAAERMFWWSADEVMGQPLPTVPVEAAEEFRELRARLIRTNDFANVEVRRRRKDGSEIECAVSAASIRDRDGAVVGTFGIVADISERKLAEQRLLKAEERYRALVEQIPVITFINEVDPDGAVTTLYVSPQVERLGFPASEWLGPWERWREQLHPEDRDWVIPGIDECLREGTPFSGEYRLLAADGRVVWVHDEDRVLQRAKRKQWRVGTFIDLTEQKQREEAKNEQLAEQILEALEAHGVPEGAWLVDIDTARGALQEADVLLRRLHDAIVRQTSEASR